MWFQSDDHLFLQSKKTDNTKYHEINPAKFNKVLIYIFFFIQDEYYKQVCGEVCELMEDTEGRSKYRWIQKYPDVEALPEYFSRIYFSALEGQFCL